VAALNVPWRSAEGNAEMGRRWVVRIAFVSFLVGLLLFSFLSYLVITGGVNEGVLRLSCSAR
jgi:hypothetical protein